ncbi:GGDEF domain-containing protein [Spongiibacter sp. KMU-158]|uniref:diguanylate cyclase n=1 Tax=Spongiibacter pelagi TaxID=2760804 RepID=A0A927C2B2_9GAMM|nr:GGDEF domain-containing protein [Spongiibacter pelagi]MBD2858190.1 GGDEF domain-containing protein [Spongiibacter pelagi]
MKISTTTAFFWSSVLCISIAGSLAYRARVEIPNQLAIEHRADQRDIKRFHTHLTNQREHLEQRVDRVYHTAKLLFSLPDHIDWRSTLPEFAKIAGWEGLDFFILADSQGNSLDIRQGERSTAQDLDETKPLAQEIFRKLGSKLKVDETLSGFLLSETQGPVMYAGGLTQWQDPNLPQVFIGVLRLTPELISEFASRLDFKVTELADHAELSAALKRDHTELGRRSTANTLYSIFHGDNQQEVLYLRFDTDPRNFESRAFSKQLIVFLIFFICSLILILLVMYREILGPINRLSAKMRQIRQHSNYQQVLNYPHKDEIGKLVNECNELLRHVQEHTQQLETISYTDALTGIGNRRLFQERLRYQWDLAQRKVLPVILIMFDLDFFKQYNDTYGHDAGDVALQKFASLLREVFARDTDVVCRTGGEEFSVLLMAQRTETAEQLTQKLLERLRRAGIEHAGNNKEKILTCSAGICAITPEQDQPSSDLFKHADIALYKAKELGRNQAQTYAS